ncbi:hypothetical protein NMY22_g8198 [Coprinellus aureogranulatus]|nr:hypothetical protein NMY22_g8198 [Coprinellus aureogranulatus]
MLPSTLISRLHTALDPAMCHTPVGLALFLEPSWIGSRCGISLHPFPGYTKSPLIFDSPPNRQERRQKTDIHSDSDVHVRIAQASEEQSFYLLPIEPTELAVVQSSSA